MTPLSARAPLRAGLRSQTLLLFGVRDPVRARCEALAVELGLGFAEVRHLLSACRALKRYPHALVIASPDLRSWDRTVFEEQVAAGKLPLIWVDTDDGAETVTNEIRRWLRASARPTRQLG